jgi:ATP-dependent Clp protease ATP-binding subunit ClpA
VKERKGKEQDAWSLLRYFQGYTAAEIGQILGLNAKHVRVLQLRALRRAALLEARERSVAVDSPTIPYNEQALRVLELTEEEARAFNHNYIGTEHLLLGILREGSAATELITHGVTLERMRGGITFIIGCPEWNPPSQLGLTSRTKEVLSLAGKEAQRMGETSISPYHLLVALLREGQGIAAQLLHISGARLEQVGETVRFSVVPDTQEGPLTLPADFQQALQQHPEARSLFEKLSYSKQKRFVDWIEQAEGEAARRQQVEKTIEQLQQIRQAHQR